MSMACRNTPSPDEQCLRAQSLLHPVCAQQPEGGAYDVSGPNSQVACHDIARACSNNPECNSRLERYNQVCSVDSKTMTCAGPPDACRKGMIDILGTELRTNCGCEGTAADFRELYDCIGWHRSLWVNPCVVEAQKDYHRIRGNLLPSSPDNVKKPDRGGPSGGFTKTPIYTVPPTRPMPEPRPETRPPPIWQPPPQPQPPQTPDRWPAVVTTNNWNFATNPPTPMMPTVPPKYPSNPWQIFSMRTTTTTTMSTTTSTTTTTLPPSKLLTTSF